MTNPEIARRRMHNQQLLGSALQTPVEMVGWLGAVQSQDYLGGKWAIGLRAGIDDAAVEQAVSQGSILRLHVLRPTWHFVDARDARWMLALTAPRIKAGAAARFRELGLDQAAFARSQVIFRQALEGGRQLTRDEMEAALNQSGFSTAVPQSLIHLLMCAELDGVICSGGTTKADEKRAKQSTYALLDERVPREPSLEREPALAELARRYFTSHGPATLKDFLWWGGLTAGDARTGIELAGDSLACETIDGQTYWSPQTLPSLVTPPAPALTAHLLPNYDEYVVAYTDRSAIFDPQHSDRLHMRGGVLNHVLIINGLVTGGWRREFKKSKVVVTVEPLWPLSAEEHAALELAALRYSDFLGLKADLRVVDPNQ